MLFYANSLFNPPPYTIPFPLTGERDVSFWRYGVRCFISVIYCKGEQCGDNGFLVHYSLLFIRFVLQNYKKLNEKASAEPGKWLPRVKV